MHRSRRVGPAVRRAGPPSRGDLDYAGL